MANLGRSEIALLARISVCTALGYEKRLEREVRVALSSGISVGVIKEAILQSYLFAGFPRAINGFWILDKILCKRDARKEVCLSEGLRKPYLFKWLKRGEKLCKEIYGDAYEAMLAKMSRFHKDFALWILMEGYGKVLARKFLSPKIREMLIIPMLVALGLWRQLPSHIKGAENVGAKQSEIAGVIKDVRNLINAKNFRKAKIILRH